MAMFAVGLLGLVVRSVTNGILDIRTAGAPPKVGNEVVFRVSVVVATFRTGRRRSDKRLKDEAVDVPLVPAPKVDVLVAKARLTRAEHPSAHRLLGAFAVLVTDNDSVQAAHAPLVTDFVAAFVPDYRAPFLMSSIHC